MRKKSLVAKGLIDRLNRLPKDSPWKWKRTRKRNEERRERNEHENFSVPFCDVGGGRLVFRSLLPAQCSRTHTHIRARVEHARSTWKGRFNGRCEETWRAYTGSKHEEEYDSSVPHPGFRPKWPLLRAVCIHSAEYTLLATCSTCGNAIQTYVHTLGRTLSRVSIWPTYVSEDLRMLEKEMES